MALQLKLDPTNLEAGAAKAKAALGGVTGAAVKAESAIDHLARNATADLNAVAPAAAKANAAIAATGKAGFAAGGGVRMLGQQLSQVAQQGAVTGNYLGALAVQLPDMALGFGSVAIAASIVATVAMPLLIGAFGDGKSGAEGMADAVENLDNAIEASNNIAKIAAGDFADLAEKYGRVTPQILALADAMRQLSLREMADAAKEVKSELTGMFSDGWTTSLEDMANGLRTGTQGTIDLAKAMDALRQNSDLGLSDQIASVANIRSNFESIVGPIQGMSAAQAEFWVMLVDTEAALSRVLDRTNEISAPIADADAQLARWNEKLSGAYNLMAQTRAATAAVAQEAKSSVGWFEMVNANISEAAVAADNLKSVNMSSGIAAAADYALSLAARLSSAFGIASAMRAMAGSDAAAPPGTQENLRWQYAQYGAGRDAATAATNPLTNPFTPPSIVTGGGGGGGGGSAAIDQTREAYDRLMASLDPVVAKTQDMAEATATANAALAAHDITAAEHANALDLIRQKYGETANAMADLQEVGGNAIDSLISGTMTLSEALKQMAKDLIFATLKAQLLKSVTGANESMSLGGIIMKAILPGLDGGGRIPMGGTAMVGERGPELVRATSGGAMVTSRVDTARQMQGGQQNVHVTVGVSVDDDGNMKAYVKKIGQAAAQSGAAQAVQTVRRSFGQWNNDLNRDGALA